MSHTIIARADRRRIHAAFARRLPYRSCYSGGDTLWRDADGRPNVLRLELYQHTHKRTGRSCPVFWRFSVNFSEPWNIRRGFWERGETLREDNPNQKIEITVLPSEAVALAEWLPLWFVNREGDSTAPLPDPPDGYLELLTWLPEREHVYYWSKAADKAYRDWQHVQEGVMVRCH